MSVSSLSASFLLGPTASGKTSLGIALAKKLDCELVCLDSMQIYRDFPIASAQPTEEERAQVKHHLFEIRDLAEHFDTAAYQKTALECVERLHSQNKQALFVGGTALYFKALTEGLTPLPGRDPNLRKSLEASWAKDEGAALREELERVDPQAASKIGRLDYRRTERALEVFRLTGTPLSEHQKKPVKAPLAIAGALALRPPRDWVRNRVQIRQKQMVKAGLEQEMHALWQRFRSAEILPPGLQAIGYRPFAAYFEGSGKLEDALETMRNQTNRLIRHQDTWLRKLTVIAGIDPSAHLKKKPLVHEALQVFVGKSIG